MTILTVLICSGAACLSSGEEAVKNKLMTLINEKNLQDEVKVIETGCMGPCQYGPLMIVYPDNSFYISLNEDKIEKIVDEHFIKGRPVKEYLWETPETRKKVEEKKIIPFFRKTTKDSFR